MRKYKKYSYAGKKQLEPAKPGEFDNFSKGNKDFFDYLKKDPYNNFSYMRNYLKNNAPKVNNSVPKLTDPEIKPYKGIDYFRYDVAGLKPTQDEFNKMSNQNVQDNYNQEYERKMQRQQKGQQAYNILSGLKSPGSQPGNPNDNFIRDAHYLGDNQNSGTGNEPEKLIYPNYLQKPKVNYNIPLQNKYQTAGPQKETREEGTHGWLHRVFEKIGLVDDPDVKKEKERQGLEQRQKDKEAEERRQEIAPTPSQMTNDVFNGIKTIIGIEPPVKNNKQPSGRTQTPNSNIQTHDYNTQSNQQSNTNTQTTNKPLEYRSDVEAFQKWYNDNWAGNGVLLNIDGKLGPKTQEQYEMYKDLWRNDFNGKPLYRHAGNVYLYKYNTSDYANIYKSGGWIQKATESIKRRGTKGKCTPITKPGCTGRARTLALTFKKMAKNRH